MIVEYVLYMRWQSDVAFEQFIRDCEASECYPWNINTLKINLHRQQRWPNRSEGYSGTLSYYDSRWTYHEDERMAVETWMTWMALKYNYSFQPRRLHIDPETNQVLEKITND